MNVIWKMIAIELGCGACGKHAGVQWLHAALLSLAAQSCHYLDTLTKDSLMLF